MTDSASTTTPITLPILNISNPNDVAVGKAMLDAAAKFGFLYVDSQGSGFEIDDMEGAFGLVCSLTSSIHIAKTLSTRANDI